MKLALRPACFALAVIAILGISLISAGCVGSVDVLPNEVSNHGNTIYVNPDYVSSATIVELLVNPENYERELFDTLNLYLPKNKPVVEVGVGTGAVMADVSKKLVVPKQHVAVEANPYLIPDLEKTISKNSLVIDLRHAAVVYNLDESYVPISVSTDLSADIVSPSETLESVYVPVTTITKLIDESTFNKATDVTLIVEASDLIKSIFENDKDLSQHVALVIGTASEMKENELASLMNIAHSAGYNPEYASHTSTSGVTTYVFKRLSEEK